ncbi:GreA/GreB family elongation factor [Deinococcus navajonensis]|uniref:GreA/GreB family elongation factor n=1 Tax=Deinococcus navajonensis TaxID=309884 RepID=A0ABV8XP97_9DEIO
MTQKIELTQDGFQRLQRTLEHEYERLEDARRVVQEQMNANENESLGLDAAQQDLMAIQERIAEIEDSLARAVLIQRPQAGQDAADLGAVVTLLDVSATRQLRLQLVNPLEASAVAGELPRVSTESPVGRGLLGRRVGETFVVDLGKRQVTYQVLDITG